MVDGVLGFDLGVTIGFRIGHDGQVAMVTIGNMAITRQIAFVDNQLASAGYILGNHSRSQAVRSEKPFFDVIDGAIVEKQLADYAEYLPNLIPGVLVRAAID